MFTAVLFLRVCMTGSLKYIVLLFVYWRVQTECSHYSMLADEAYRLLIQMRDRDALSQSLAVQLCDWLELVDEVMVTL